MEEWGIRAGMTAAGAVIGAVVRPYVEHRLRHRQQAEERIRQRNATIRKMIEQRLDKFRKELHFARAVGLLIDAGASGDEAFKEASLQAGPIFSIESSSFWKPARISDTGVKYLCEELGLSMDVLLKLAVAASRGRNWEQAELLKRLPYDDLRLQRLEEMIITKMDEIGW